MRKSSETLWIERKSDTDWRLSKDDIWTFADKYAVRYVERLAYRVTAFKFYFATATFSDTVAFWIEEFVTPEDATKAAKRWCLRGELAHSPETEESFEYAPEVYLPRSPEVERSAW